MLKIKTTVSLDYARIQGYIAPEYTLDNGYIHSGDIIKCPICQKKVNKVNISKEECHGALVDSEFDYQCEYCLTKLGHYFYGNYDYYFIEKVSDGNE